MRSEKPKRSHRIIVIWSTMPVGSSPQRQAMKLTSPSASGIFGLLQQVFDAILFGRITCTTRKSSRSFPSWKEQRSCEDASQCMDVGRCLFAPDLEKYDSLQSGQNKSVRKRPAAPDFKTCSSWQVKALGTNGLLNHVVEITNRMVKLSALILQSGQPKCKR